MPQIKTDKIQLYFQVLLVFKIKTFHFIPVLPDEFSGSSSAPTWANQCIVCSENN